MHIIIADSHTVCREALSAYLCHADETIDISCVGDYASLTGTLSAGAPVDMLLLDSDLPGLPEPAGEMDFSDAYPALHIGIMMAHTAASDSGPNIFPKALGGKAILDGVYCILSGQDFRPVSRQWVEDSMPYKTQDECRLTQRERQVLGHLLQGAANKEIARAMDLQIVTVKLHVRGICRKIGAKNRTQAALIAKENGWLL